MTINNKPIGRRNFLKTLGGGVVAASTLLTGCSSNESKSILSSTHQKGTGKMTYRKDVHGTNVSLLCFGCMRFPTIKGDSGRENANNDLDQEEINRMVDHAIENGVNLFDTSPAYCQGRSEKALGIALSRHDRSKFLVSTKMSNFGNFTREASIEMYNNSFKELQVDYIDYYLLHSVGGGEDAMAYFEDRYIKNGMLDFLLNERKAGRIRNLGFSYHGDIRIFDYLLSRHDEIKWDFVLIQLNYVDWKHAKKINPSNTNAEYLYSEIEKRGIPGFVMEPLLGGRLADLNDHATELLQQRDHNASIASWAFRFAGSKPGILSVMSGMTYMEHLQDNIKTYSPLQPLSDDEYKLLEEIATIYANYPMVPCNTCQYCMPCPYGIDIPKIFTHFNKCLNEGNVVEDRQDKGYKDARRAFLVGYDRSVPKLRQADHCIGCNHCVPHCPQKIDIPGEMHRINSFVENLKRDGTELGCAVQLAALIRQLDENNYSCIIKNNDVTQSFTQRGVFDLHDLVAKKDEILKGGYIADKIVGKGAASMMIIGGIKAVRTHVISQNALNLLKEHNVIVHYDTVVETINNRTNTGICPVETRVKDCTTLEQCWEQIQQFVAENRH
jgi:predicted aldo/keto reductase-like oxidoreductase